MNYLIGDLQGCCDPLEQLLAEIQFSPSRDRLYVLGDMVNRGPASLQVLRRLHAFGDAAVCLLGNHDLHLLAVAEGVRRTHRSDTLDELLDSPERDRWIDWLRHQPLAAQAEGWLMVHAGVVPQWDMAQTLALAAEVETGLRGSDLRGFLSAMFGNQPDLWSEDLQGFDRQRFTINVLTRIRFCTAEGRLDFQTKDSATQPPPGLMPWFEVPGRRTAGVPIAFGHWSTLGLLQRPDLLALDTGCVWGGHLSAARLRDGGAEIIQVPCPQAQVPG